jgi:hypothetical protein
VALNSALTCKALTSPQKELSSEGQRLVRDLRDVIDQARKLFLSKNEGNLLQEFIWNASHIGANGANKPNVPVDKQTAQQETNQALAGLKTLGELLITNGEFRKLRKQLYSMLIMVYHINNISQSTMPQFCCVILQVT